MRTGAARPGAVSSSTPDCAVTSSASSCDTSEGRYADWRRQTLALIARHAPVTLALLAASWWVIIATRWWGGREPGAVTGGAIVTALATIATRPDRVLPRRAVCLATAISAGAFIVALSSPTGWAGAPNASEYVCAAWTVVAVAAAVVRDRRIVTLLVILLMLGVVIEFRESWLAWVGGDTASRPIVGTFYWWNPFAAYLIAGSVLGLAAFLRSSPALATVGIVAFVLGSIGIVYSTSRAAGACFVVAVAALVLGAVIRYGWRSLMRVAAALGLAALGVWVVAGPPFFSRRVTPFAGTAARGSGQSLGQNGSYRLEFWHEAVRVFRRFPLTGGGFHSMAVESVGHVPTNWSLSPLAHNGYLQALADGGLVLGVPFLLGCAGVGWLVLRSVYDASRTRDFSLVEVAIPLALGALLVHSAVDFDWSYPADFTLTAVLAGIVLGMRCRRSGRESTATAGSRRVMAAVALAGVSMLGVAAVTSWSGDLRLNLPIGPASAGVR